MGDHADDVAAIEDAVVALVRAATRPALQLRFIAKAAVPVERSGYELLRVVADEGDVRMTDIAERLGVDASTASRQVKQLVEAGLLERKDDPDDGRAKRLSLTKEGLRAVGRLQSVRHDVFDSVLAEWPEADRAALAPLLARLAVDLKRKVGEPT
jgi:DNA-binding MarR family transcriptional regulator